MIQDHAMKKYTIEDFKKFSFRSGDPKETNLADKVDEIVYGQELESDGTVYLIDFNSKH